MVQSRATGGVAFVWTQSVCLSSKATCICSASPFQAKIGALEPNKCASARTLHATPSEKLAETTSNTILSLKVLFYFVGCEDNKGTAQLAESCCSGLAILEASR